MKLFYHPASPFCRIIFMLAKERGLQDKLELQKVVVCPVPYPGWSDNNEEVSKANPIGKIPTLVLDNGQALFDSRVIGDYLESLSTVTWPATDPWPLRVIHSCALGMMDAEVSTVYEDRIRGENGVKFQPWFDGMRIKVFQSLDFLERAAAEGILESKASDQPVNQAEIAVAVGLLTLDSRLVDWRTGRTALVSYYEQTWAFRSSLFETDVSFDWKMGKPVEGGGFQAY